MKGMLSRQELGDLVERGEVETVLAVFPDLYGRLMGKRIQGPYFLEEIADGGMHACDYLLACDMEMDAVPGYRYTNWETGYGDFHCVPDLSTLRRAAWLPKTVLVICDLLGHHEEPVEVSPRRMLQRQLERAREAGFTVMGGTEIELYVFDDSFAEARAKNYHGLRPMGTYNEDYHILQGTKEEELIGAIRRGLDHSGVPIEFSKGEAGERLHLENRVGCGGSNPYLLGAGAIAAGLDGIRNRIEPPEVFQGDIYASLDLPRIPTSLREAISEFETCDLAREAFGEDVYEHYLHFLRTEQRKFDEVVTCWERARYFERA